MKRLLALLLCLALLVPAAFAIPADGEAQLALLEEIKDYLDNYHLYPAPEGTPLEFSAAELEADPSLLRQVADAWLSGDRYGYFLTAEEYETSFPQGTSTVGIGIEVDIRMPLGTYVSGFLEGSSAARSGMELGCQIVAVDGVDVTDEPFIEVARPLIAGDIPLTTVSISYINPGETRVHTETFQRDSLRLPPHVQGHMLDDETAYISISQFGGMNDFYTFHGLYNEELPALGATRLIVDLRGNPGGELDTILNILNCMIAEEGQLLLRMLYRGEQEEFFTTGQDAYEVWQPESIAVLIDGDSYSASEVFAGTLQGLGMATVVGQNSGGKSRAQYHVPLASGDMLVFTYSDIELPGIGNYYETGITPDLYAEPETVSGAEMGLPALESRAMFRYCRDGERVKALEQRLSLLGYFRAEPDGVMNDYTLWCFARFQAAMGRAQTSYIGRADLELLEALLCETEFMPVDTQLEAALALGA